jgi:SulP family sulfate permease
MPPLFRRALITERVRFGTALRDRLAEGYRAPDLRADILAGLVVGLVALPLAMALAIAVGVPPQHGLYTAIVAGALAALLGGSRLSVTGPTAAFVVVLAPVVQEHGLPGLLLATMLGGVIQVLLGACRMGRLIQFIPYPVTTGFTAGIAVVIATLQVQDALGLRFAVAPGNWWERVVALGTSLPSVQPAEAGVAAFTLALLVLWPRCTRRVPAPLVALGLAGLAAWALPQVFPGTSVATIGSRFHAVIDGLEVAGIPQALPAWHLPWTDIDGGPSLGVLRALLGPAFAIALLGAIESLLCAVVADGMTGTRHDPDGELLAQGVGNIVAPLFGGIAATGAIARTATNVRAGARSPLASVVHALFVLAALLALAPLLAWLPMAGLAALLLLVAFQMSEVRHFMRILKVAPRSDVAVLLTCFGLTVVIDMVAAVTVGVVLAALLFMRRMAEISGVQAVGSSHAATAAVPADVLVYAVAGPLFFGAAEKAVSAMHRGHVSTRAVIIDLSDVPAMDMTGLVALESVLDRLGASGTTAVLAGVRRQPRTLIERAGMPTRVPLAPDVAAALCLLPPAGDGAG